MSIVHPKSQWQWLLLLLLSFVLVHAFETPRETITSATTTTTTTPPPAPTQCQHDSIPDLIKSSPVILKALGARIFTDYDSYPFQDDIEITEELILKAQQEQRRDVPAAAVLEAAAASRRSSSSSSSSWSRSSSSNHLEDDDNEDDDVSFSVEDSVFASAGNFDGASEWAAAVSFDAETGSDRRTTTTTASKSTLIALTPVTIYKGASLLKITQQPDGMSSRGAGESSYQYEEQLNATLEPLACFDSNILKLLPTEIIAFGKLVSDQRPDVLRISINGLHRWSPQFENRIWKYLGWDDWSDFTLCSVQCGKGVQQRFRRCLLDNPMININMNNNNNNNINSNDMQQKQQPKQENQDAVDASSSSSSSRSSSDSGPSNVPNQAKQHHYQHHQHHHHQQKQQKQQKQHHQQQPLLSMHSRGSISSNSKSNSGNGSSRSRNHSTSPEKDSSSNMSNETKSTTSGGQWGIDRVAVETAAGAAAAAAATDSVSLNKLKKRRKRKKAKSLSTMSCEGYNIEQRNCNTFECTDDISDLLKFYKKFLPLEELPTTLVPQQQSESTMLVQQQMPTVSELALGGGGGATSSSFITSSSFSSILGSSVPAAAAATVAVSSPPSTASTTLLPNTGYIRSWKNSLNFTLMITLRLKNDTKSTSTVFSIRNTTHNLYVETSANGLRLLQERDNATEMLPVKFQLYDNRWHQVSISFQNGDFISIYVDCSWTNSFVVSKRLFSLPNDADVEIGRGFSGELQQILVLPDNQERHQCSNVRTSINEVKRYIIDTFIDDYGN